VTTATANDYKTKSVDITSGTIDTDFGVGVNA
jgi:hypothetical protein